MTYPGSRPHTWAPGERVDDTVLNPWGPVNVAWGYVGSVTTTLTTAFTQAGGVIDLAGLTLSPTLRNDRKYRIGARTPFRMSTNGTGGNPETRLSITDNANVGLGDCPDAQHPTAWGALNWAMAWGETLFTPAATGVQVIKVRLQTMNATTPGSGVLGGTQRLYVEDIGPSVP